MITYRLLSSNDFNSLFECFLAAFSDYQVDMKMSREQFELRLARDGVRLDVSVGAFDESKMVGFYMNALGEWQGKQTAYDAGTGVTPAYRRQGIAEELFAHVVPRLKEIAVEQYLLEVLTGNERAIRLYRKLGFVETRRFAVFRKNEPVTPLGDSGIGRVERPDWELFKSFWDGYPSWQNSIDAVDRIPNERVVVCAYVDEMLVGYGVAFKPWANLMQLAVAREHRRKGIGSRILAALQAEMPESLKVTNVDEELIETMTFFDGKGFEMVFEQLEMVKTF